MNNTPPFQDQLTEPGGLAYLLRQSRGKQTASSLAKRAGWPISKVSKIEHGRQLPTVDEEADDLATWARLTGAGEADVLLWRGLLAAALAARIDFAAEFRRGQRRKQQQYNEIIERAATCRLFENTFIPRFLQTVEYSRAVATESWQRHGGEKDIEATVAERQKSLAWLDDPERSFELLLTEPVLCWRWAALPFDVHLAQLRHLQEFFAYPGQRPNVRVGIIPMFEPIGWVPQNGFQLLGAEHGFTELWVHELHDVDEKDLSRLNRVFDRLWESARTDGDAYQIIQRVIDRLEQAGD